MSEHQMRPLRLGQLCITVNSDEALNDGQVVEVVSVYDPPRVGPRGELMRYCITRIDGQPICCARRREDGVLLWFKARYVSCPRWKLKPLEDEGPEERVQEALVMTV